MISTLTGSGAGPISGFIATGRISARYINVFSYRKNTLVPTLVTQPTDATNWANSIAWNSNADFLAVATFDNPAGLKFFKRTGSTFASQSVPSNFRLDYGDCAIAADGSYVAAVSSQSPYGRIWHNNNGTLTNLSSIGTLGTNHRAVAVSSTGNYVAILGNSPFLIVKVRSGSGNSATFSNMTLATQPVSGVSSGTSLAGLAFSPDDTYLAVSPVTQANQTIYKWDSGTNTYVQLVSPFVGALPNSSVSGCSFDHQGNFLAIATFSNTFFYERSGDTFTGVANVSDGGRGNFHPSGNFYITGSGVIYRKNSASSWTQVTTITAGNAAAFSPFITT